MIKLPLIFVVFFLVVLWKVSQAADTTQYEASVLKLQEQETKLSASNSTGQGTQLGFPKSPGQGSGAHVSAVPGERALASALATASARSIGDTIKDAVVEGVKDLVKKVIEKVIKKIFSSVVNRIRRRRCRRCRPRSSRRCRRRCRCGGCRNVFEDSDSEPDGYFISNPVLSLTNDTNLGVAQIFNNGEQICSGVHFKPWIVLTAASCVKGKDPKSLRVGVRFKMPVAKDPNTYRSSVAVKEIHIVPSYRDGQPKHNLALMYIYVRYFWNVGEFIVPPYYMPPETYAGFGKTKMNYWKKEINATDYTLYEVNRTLLTDCKGIGIERDWFCAKKDKANETFSKVDVGTPLYHKESGTKQFLGLYSGWNKDQKSTDYIFESIWPHIDWFDRFMMDRPLPPVNIDMLYTN